MISSYKVSASAGGLYSFDFGLLFVPVATQHTSLEKGENMKNHRTPAEEALSKIW